MRATGWVLAVAGVLLALVGGWIYARPTPLLVVNDERAPLGAFHVRNAAPAHAGLAVGHVHAREEAEDAHSVRVRMAFVGLNPIDFKLMEWAPVCRPRGNDVCGLGRDGAGVVVSVGSAVKRVRAGDRVLVMGTSLARQEVVVPDTHVVRVPQQWSLESAAAIPIVALASATSLLDQCSSNVGPDGAVLVLGSGSNTGRVALDLLSFYRLRRIIAFGSNETEARARGATDFINRLEETIDAGLARINPGKIDIVYECVHVEDVDVFQLVHSGNYGSPCFVTIDPGHHLLSFALNWARRFFKSLFGAPKYLVVGYPLHEGLGRLADLMEHGGVRPLGNHRVFSLTTQGVEDAFAFATGGRGKALLRMQ